MRTMRTYDRESMRIYARQAAARSARNELIEILGTKGVYPTEVYVAARDELIARYSCNDCGAPAGRWCYPEYGCLDTSRGN